jgi:membrane-associated protein
MNLLHQILDIFLHLDKHLTEVTQQYGALTYALLFAIIFCETGLVILPFLPGDSLLFAAGALGALGTLHPWALVVLLCIAAILGDAVNYSIGHFLGPKLKAEGKLPFIKQEYLDRTHKFYEKYGKSTIILARFVPIVRTFAPFLAGVGSMSYTQFAAYNIIGGVLWVNLFTWAGYFFGNIEFVRKNFGMVIIAIMIISVVPLVIEFIKFRQESKAEAAAAQKP